MARTIERTKRRGYYGDGGGLFLQVSARGSKSWVFRFKDNGKLREMGLGPTHTVTLAHAVGDKVEAAYRRGDLFQKRRQLAEAWARGGRGYTSFNEAPALSPGKTSNPCSRGRYGTGASMRPRRCHRGKFPVAPLP